jgi:hypothetical protein
LTHGGVADALGHERSAIGIYCMGYCSGGTHDGFDMKYIGKAVDQPIYERLQQHLDASHNPHIRAHLQAKPGTKPPVWFRHMIFASKGLAEECEGVVIAALLWDIKNGRRVWRGWNRRNEWSQQARGE